jgi:hypothetical protein
MVLFEYMRIYSPSITSKFWQVSELQISPVHEVAAVRSEFVYLFNFFRFHC